MLTNLYTRTTPMNQTVASNAKDIFGLLLSRQSDIVDWDYNRGKRSKGGNRPHLADTLATLKPEISLTDDQVQIVINYPITIRFLDLKKTKYGKKKRYYTAVYNRPLFGHVYGRGYSLSNMVNMAFQQNYRNYHTNLQNIMKTIDL